MRKNRSMPKARVIPELEYADVEAASAWLCDAFGFALRISMGSHRAQLNVADDGAIVIIERTTGGKKFPSHSLMIRVEDADAHAKHAAKKGAKIVRPAMDYPYGERQYTAEDFAGNRWTFSQTIADVAPESWGGKSKKS